MSALIITLITSLFEIADQLFGSQLGVNVPAIEIFLAAVTPLLVWLSTRFGWQRWPEDKNG